MRFTIPALVLLLSTNIAIGYLTSSALLSSPFQRRQTSPRNSQMLKTQQIIHFAPSNHYYPQKKSSTSLNSNVGQNSQRVYKYYDDGEDNDEDDHRAEIVDIGDDDDDEQDWISDRELIRRAANAPGGEALTNRDKTTLKKFRYANHADPDDFFSDVSPLTSTTTTRISTEEDEIDTTSPEDEALNTATTDDNDTKNDKKTKSPYTDEEEKLINSMGGKEGLSSQKARAPGYLGDSTLLEISRDYSVPICYIADVLVSWGSPIPVDVNARLGDLVTGEQAFALLEAIHTLDIAELHDRYSDEDLATVVDIYEMDLKEAYDLAVAEGWNLPFGVRTFLRREQEDELIKSLAPDEY
eukprot:CAMPEP_0172509846 /NCGR_PEP_ID=MMETSP1066-20121228/223767_1 /TAXON_ID=671091 /ORGANISM="Coscinodiscus wailesii, Strain CCMP2513" /LENGTH=353 /DNA_ID=CAMNT_0013288541 /DNA_START=90 /DNA_END=1151 /DNA_ORIENTATION=-